MSLLQTSLQTLKTQFTALQGHGGIGAALVHEPVLDPSEIAKGLWRPPIHEVLRFSRTHNLGPILYYPPVEVPELSRALSQAGQIHFADPPFDEDGRLVILDDAGQPTAVTAGALREISLGWQFDAPSPINDFLSAANGAGHVLVDAPLCSGIVIPQETLKIEDGRSRWIHALFDLAWQELLGSPLRVDVDRKITIPAALRPREPQPGPELRRVRRTPRVPESRMTDRRSVMRPRQARPFWHSELADVVRASVYAIDILLGHLPPEADVGSTNCATSPASRDDKAFEGLSGEHGDAGSLDPFNSAKKKGKGGRPRKSDDLWRVITELEGKDPDVTDDHIAKTYNQRFGSAIGQGKKRAATPTSVKNLRYERTRRKRRDGHR